jgi:hypothetical protein
LALNPVPEGYFASSTSKASEIDAAHQRFETLDAFGVLQIQRNRKLAAIDLGEQFGSRAHIIARRLPELDHLGPELREIQDAERPRQQLGQI